MWESTLWQVEIELRPRLAPSTFPGGTIADHRCCLCISGGQVSDLLMNSLTPVYGLILGAAVHSYVVYNVSCGFSQVCHEELMLKERYARNPVQPRPLQM